jgi:hypothetical protein
VARRGQTVNNTRAVPRGKPAAPWPADGTCLARPIFPETLLNPMQYEEQSRRLGLLGGFALGIAFGAGVGLLMGAPRRTSGSDAVERARGLRAPTGRSLRKSAGGATGRMARKKFAL